MACPHPFSVDRIEVTRPFGLSLAGLMREAGIDPDPIYARVFIDDRLIDKAYWERVKPKAGHLVTVRVIPTGSGNTGKDILRVVALIAVTVASIYVPGAFGLAPGIASGLLSASISIAGACSHLNLMPPRPEDAR